LNGIKSCPSTKGCENQFFVDETQQMVYCACGYKFCPKCMEEPHPKMNCEQFRIAEIKRKKDQKNADAVDEKFFKNYKRCPWCTALIERISGCDCMTCSIPSCKQKFCITCL
jgi:hypothetical protein